MASGRPSRRGSMAPAPARASSSRTASQGTRRSTRSSANMATPSGQEPPAGPSEKGLQSPVKTRPRTTRASRATLASTPSTRAFSGAAAESSLMGSGSTSSVPTSLPISSESDYSTPGTSKSPDARESSRIQKGKERCSIEVHIPAKGKGKEIYHGSEIQSMNSVGKSSQVLEIEDSDDEGYGYFGGPDTSRDADFALRLQNEEYASVGQSFESSDFGLSNNRPFRARESIASSSRSQAESSKRARAASGSSTRRGRPSKKPKVVADSQESDEEFDLSDVDTDEIIIPPDVAPALSVFDEDEGGDGLADEVDALVVIKKNSTRSKYTARHVFAKPSTKAESDFEDDAPVTTKKNVSRGKYKARAKFVVPPNLSDPEDGAPLGTQKISSHTKSTRSKVPSIKSESDSEDDAPIASGRTPLRYKSKVPLLNAESDSEDEDDDLDFISLSEALSGDSSTSSSEDEPGSEAPPQPADPHAVLVASLSRRAYRQQSRRRVKKERNRLEEHHPELKTMWKTLEDMPILKTGMAPQPPKISRQLKPFQREGLAWMLEMEKTEWKGGLLGDEMGLGKTIQAVSLIMSDYPAKQPTLVLVPPVALMQWQSEISSYTDGTLKTFVFHGTNKEAKNITVKGLKAYDVIMMSYNSLESMYRRQEKGFVRANGIHKEKSVIHAIKFHRAILDEAHCIKTRTTMTAKACFALKTEYRWCLTGTPLQNRIGELFSLVRFLNIRPFTSYLCKQCPCTTLEWSMDQSSRCSKCGHIGMQHVSLFNQELLNPIQKFGNLGPGHQAFKKLRLMTDRIMLRRLKRDHTDSMELPVKEIYVDRQFFGEEENDFANSIMTSGQRRFDTYVAQGVLLNNYANIFGLIMQMRQVADHPDLILKKNAEGGQNVLVCCICDEPAEDTVRSRCKHDFCRTCVSAYVRSTDEPDCPRCHIPLVIDLEQPEIEQDENLMKKSSIINRIKMENWTSSSKIELLVHELHKLRSDNASHKSIIFSQFTTMLQLIEWRLRRAGITTVMLDGSMTPAQRQASIDHFMNNVDVECFLVSLKAGGVALNLTEASRVFIVDPWWNPAAEWQSADRCHRIGQTRPCTITRLCIEDSVESRMVLIQEKKTSMIHSTVNADDKAMDTLTPQDMQFLFRGH